MKVGEMLEDSQKRILESIQSQADLAYAYAMVVDYPENPEVAARAHRDAAQTALAVVLAEKALLEIVKLKRELRAAPNQIVGTNQQPYNRYSAGPGLTNGG